MGLRTKIRVPHTLFNVRRGAQRHLLRLHRVNMGRTLYKGLNSCRLTSRLKFRPFNSFNLGIFGDVSTGRVGSPVLSFRLTLSVTGTMGTTRANVVICNELPLVLAEGYPMGDGVNYMGYNGGNELASEGNIRFPIHYSPCPYIRILGSIPLCVTSEVGRIGSSFTRFCFASRSLRRIRGVVTLCRGNSGTPFSCAEKLCCENIL